MARPKAGRNASRASADSQGPLESTKSSSHSFPRWEVAQFLSFDSTTNPQARISVMEPGVALQKKPDVPGFPGSRSFLTCYT